MSLHHLALGARDVDRVARFYSAVLRMKEVRRFHTEEGDLRSIWLSLGGAVLMVERTAEPHRNVQGVGAGPFLLAVGWPEGLAHAGRWLEARKIAIEDRSEFSLYFRDPEGNRVAVSVYPLTPEA